MAYLQLLPRYVSTHSRLKAAGGIGYHSHGGTTVSTHSRLKAAGSRLGQNRKQRAVSTHSRLKAAGRYPSGLRLESSRFNTQPPEGGWLRDDYIRNQAILVSTHSRLKAAGKMPTNCIYSHTVSTHSRLKAAGAERPKFVLHEAVSTHSRLKAAGCCCTRRICGCLCFNTQPPEGGWLPDLPVFASAFSFQHTAA